MVPAKPPLPICSYFPFQRPFVGIQTSNLILESLLGLEVPATRQRSTGALVTPDTISPARYDRASVTFVCGSERSATLAHIDAAAERSICQANEVKVAKVSTPNTNPVPPSFRVSLSTISRSAYRRRGITAARRSS